MEGKQKKVKQKQFWLNILINRRSGWVFYELNPKQLMNLEYCYLRQIETL